MKRTLLAVAVFVGCALAVSGALAAEEPKAPPMKDVPKDMRTYYLAFLVAGPKFSARLTPARRADREAPGVHPEDGLREEAPARRALRRRGEVPRHRRGGGIVAGGGEGVDGAGPGGAGWLLRPRDPPGD